MISENLTNDQIRALFNTSLSRVDLDKIARQRAISTTGKTKNEIEKKILRNLDRQEGYARLSKP